jgi:GT2 family glycosyltransferase
VDVIRRHAERLSYWASEPDGGQADAINKGFERARGHILAWLNSDDEYEPGAVRAAVEAFCAHPEADALYGDCAYVDEAGKLLTVFRGQPFDLAGYLTTEGFIHQPTVFFRRRVLEQVGLLDPAFHLCLDYEYWLRIGLACRWHYLPRTLARFRLHPLGKSYARSPEFLGERVRCLDRLFSDRRIPPQASRKRRQAYAVAYLSGGERAYESGDTREARARLLTALRWDPNPLRPKTVKALLLLGDLLTGFRIGKSLVDRHLPDRWTRRRSRVPEGTP